MIYDGSGLSPFAGDVAIDGDAIAAVGSLAGATGRTEVDAAGLAVTPVAPGNRLVGCLHAKLQAETIEQGLDRTPWHIGDRQDHLQAGNLL